MKTEPDAKLKSQFLSLLLRADPNVGKRQALAEEFAGHLAAFTQNWATDAKDIDDQQEALRKWIDANAAKVASRPRAMAAGAGFGEYKPRRRPAKKR
jgi:hypothetical protein